MHLSTCDRTLKKLTIHGGVGNLQQCGRRSTVSVASWKNFFSANAEVPTINSCMREKRLPEPPSEYQYPVCDLLISVI